MDGFLDIYGKLIIALVSFTAPFMTFLLSVPSPYLLASEKKTMERLLQMDKLSEMQKNFKPNEDTTKLYNKSFTLLLKKHKDNVKKTNLLNAKRQIYRTFMPLMLALLFIMIYKVVKDKSFNIYSHSVAIVLILLSLICFVYSLRAFKQITWVAIDAKKAITPNLPGTTLGSS